jgi:hypothetical protein
MLEDSPVSSDIASVVARAAAARRHRHRANPRHYLLTNAAIADLVTGFACQPRQAKNGWWLVGHVLDGIADAEFEVWYIPGDCCSQLPLRFARPRGKTPTGTS